MKKYLRFLALVFALVVGLHLIYCQAYTRGFQNGLQSFRHAVIDLHDHERPQMVNWDMYALEEYARRWHNFYFNAVPDSAWPYPPMLNTSSDLIFIRNGPE